MATRADDVGAGGDDYSSGNGGGTPSSLPAILEDIYNFFNDLFGGGGGSSLPPNYFVYKARLQRGKRHPLYGQIIGINSGLIPTEASACKLCGDPHPCNTPPLQKKGPASSGSNVCQGNYAVVKQQEFQLPGSAGELFKAIVGDCLCYYGCVSCNGSLVSTPVKNWPTRAGGRR